MSKRLHLILSIILIIDSVIFAEEFHEDSLHTVWGEKNWMGIEDCSASADLISFNNEIIIEVKVKDDFLYFSDDPLHSDHIELWFAIPEIYDDKYFSFDNSPIYPNEFIVGNKYLYLYKGRPDLDSLKIEIGSPLIETFNYGKKFLYYNEIKEKKKKKNPDYLSSEDYVIDDIDEYLKDARNSNLKKEYIFFGITHLGILPSTSDKIVYDKENYAIIEKMTGSELGNLTKYVRTLININNNSYNIKIFIKAPALGFVKRNGLDNLAFLIDIIDTDRDRVQETLLSSSKNRIWGNPKTFNKLKIKKNINVKLNENIQALGKSDKKSKIDQNIRYTFPLIFWFTTKGWRPIYFAWDKFRYYDQPSVMYLRNIIKCRIEQCEISYEKQLLGNNILENYNSCDDQYLIVNNKLIKSTKEFVFTFLLPDNSIGIIMSDFNIGGGYNYQIQSVLKLITEKSSAIIAEYYQPDFKVADSIYLKHTEVDYNIIDRAIYTKESENIDWKQLVSWNKPGESVILNLGKESIFKIFWDEHGQNIKLKKAFEQ